MPVTVVLAEVTLSAETKANSNSLPDTVEKAEVLTAVLAVPWLPNAVESMAIAPCADLARKESESIARHRFRARALENFKMLLRVLTQVRH